MTNSIEKVIDQGFCVGCGGCAYKNSQVEIQNNQLGLKVATTPTPNLLDDAICPFSSKQNESTIGEDVFSNNNVNFEKRIGYFEDLFAGKVSDDTARVKSSSGGLTTWLLQQLFERGEIDGVVHVGESSEEAGLFEYTISNNIKELKTRGKSRYYPTNFNKALEQIDLTKKYAFVGIPCYVKAARLLCLANPDLNNSLKYFIGIFCGHLKSTGFAEYLSWQMGIKPENLNKIDFRVKNAGGYASNYSISAEDRNGVEKSMLNKHLDGTDWGLGYFKPLACEFCDDISAETADIVFGDAWLPEYNADNLGTNIVISRNKFFSELLKSAATDNSISLDTLTIDKIIQSQAANYRHRHEGLSVRLNFFEEKGLWHPQKRIKISDFNVTAKRKSIYLLRMKISEKSHTAFLRAKQNNSLFLFFATMLPLELRYYMVNKNALRRTIKSIVVKFKILFNKSGL